MQIVLALLPWVLYGDWGVMLVTLSGTFLVVLTCSMPQGAHEKWAGRILERPKTTCLTRGNGSLHNMVFISGPGAWDMESLASAPLVPRAETRWISLMLAVLWTCLMIIISGLQAHTWFLVGIGGLGMLQNIIAAGTPRKTDAFNFQISSFTRAPTIIGRRSPIRDDSDSEVDLESTVEELDNLQLWAKGVPATDTQGSAINQTAQNQMPAWLSSISREDGVPDWLEAILPEYAETGDEVGTPLPRQRLGGSQETQPPEFRSHKCVIYAQGVQGAFMELEKWIPNAGMAMLQLFFPGGHAYNNASIRYNSHKKFWKRSHATSSLRLLAEQKRRDEEGNRGRGNGVPC